MSENTPAGIDARYELLGEVGRGGMGIVYKARDRETSEIVAIKLLKPEIAAEPRVIDRFKNELRLARKITHRNVCRIYEFHRANGTTYISMEFVEGESLRHILKRFRTISLRKGIEIAQQICAGLREAHAQGIVHRDLKPENVMVDAEGSIKVMDFGIARSIETSTTGTVVIGTPAYMAPEQAEGKHVDPRADIYALGLVLYEMFTGSQAFSGDTPIGILLKQMREQPVPVRQVEPSVPKSIECVITKCLEKDAANRFESVDEVVAALDSAIKDNVATVEEEETREKARPLSRRAGLEIGVVALAFVVGFLTGRGWSPRRGPMNHPPDVNSLAFSPDGNMLASAGEDKTIKIWDITNKRELRTLKGHTRAVTTVAFSPDGRWLASGSTDRTIKIWDVSAGKELRTFEGHAAGIGAVAFSPKGDWVASGAADGAVKVWEFESGRPFRSFKSHKDDVLTVAFSPDGRLLASGSADEVIKLWEVSTGRELRSLTGHTDYVNAVAFSPDGQWLASAGIDKMVKVWDVRAGRERHTLAGHSGPVYGICFTPDGESILSGGEDGTIRVWDVATGFEIRTLTKDAGTVVCIALAPNGDLLAWGKPGGEIETLRFEKLK